MIEIVTQADLTSEFYRIMFAEKELGHVEYIPDAADIYPLAKDIHLEEEWAKDFFELLESINYSSSSVSLAIVVMSGLLTNGKWYQWREKEYA